MKTRLVNGYNVNSVKTINNNNTVLNCASSNGRNEIVCLYII